MISSHLNTDLRNTRFKLVERFMSGVLSLFIALWITHTFANEIVEANNLPAKIELESQAEFPEQSTVSLTKTKFQQLLSQQELTWLQQHPLIRVSSEPDYAPFDFQVDGISTGYSVDLVNLLAERLGIQVVYVQDNFNELIKKVQRKEIDLVHTIFNFPKERAEFMNFSQAYKNSVSGIVVRDDENKINGLNDLNGRRVAVVKGEASADLLKQQFPHITPVEFSNYENALKSVALGSADASVIELPVINYLKRKLLLTNLKIAAELDVNVDYRYRFASRKDWPELASILNKALDSLTPQELNRLDDRWLLTTSEHKRVAQLSKEERNWLARHPVIKVQNESEYVPYNFNDGVAKGFSIDYMNLLGEKLGIKFEYISGHDWQEYIDMIQQGQLDVMVNIIETEKRRKYLLFTRDYQRLTEGIFTKPGDNRYESLSALNGKKMAVVDGYYQAELLEKLYPEIQQIKVKSDFEAIEAVLTDKADAFSSDTALVNFLQSQRAIGGVELSSINKDPMFQNNFSLGIRFDWPELKNILQKAMDAVQESEIRELREKWLTGSTTNRWIKDNLNAQEVTWLAEHRKIKVASENGFVPLNFRLNGQAKGFAIDHMNLIAKRIGIEYEYVTAPDWNEFMAMLRDGRVDVMPNIINTDKRQQFIAFTKGYMDSYSSIYCKSDALPIQSLKQLNGKRLTIVGGYFEQELIESFYPEIKLVLKKNVYETVVAVMNGEADATIIDPIAVPAILQKMGVEGFVQTGVVSDERFTNITALGVSKNQVILRDILQKAMDDINYLEIQKLYRKWYPDTLGKSVSSDIRLPNLTAQSERQDSVSQLLSWQTLAAVGLTLILFVGAILFLIRLLERSRKDPLAYQFVSFRGKQLVLLFNVVLIVSALILVWWSLQNIKTKVKDDLRDTLQTVTKTTLETMNIWVSDQKTQLNTLAADPRVVALAKEQVKNYEQNKNIEESDALFALRELFTENQRVSEHIGFFIIAKDGMNIASMRDSNIGQSNLILKERPGLFRRVMNGETLLIPPIISDVPLNNVANVTGSDNPPALFFAAPIIDKQGHIFAVLTRRLDPQAEFTRIHQLGRLRESGETYSFDRQGRLLSESRFTKQLIEAGLIKEFEQSILSIKIVDPGGNLLEGYKRDIPSDDLELTVMAKHAINIGAGFNVDGYRDYRGVTVLGAWQWDEKLGLGMATEIDYDEAMGAYKSARLALVVTVVVTVSISIVFTLLTIILGSRANRVLHSSRERLEQRVQERTAALERALKYLAEEEHKLQIVVDNFPGPLSLKDGNGKYLLINSMGEEFLGVSKVEAIGKTDLELFPEETAQFILSKDREAIESREKIQYEQQLPSSDGKLHEVLTTKVAIVSKDDADTQVIAVALDISKLKNAERALRQALQDLDEQQFVLDQHAMVTVTDLNGIITYANQKFIEICGYNEDELIGQDHRILDSGVHNKKFWKSMYQALEQSGVWHDEVCNRSKSGRLFWVDSTVAAFKGEDGNAKAYIAIRTDISERKLYEKELLKSMEKAEAANRAKSEFLASMSHEIRTPLNGVLGMLGLIQRSTLTPEQKHRTSIAKSSAQALLVLINDILDFSKIEAGKLDLEEIDFHLPYLIEDIAHTQVFRCEEKGIKLRLDLTGIEQSMVRGDPGRVRQILLNLLGNAIKFTEEGEIAIKAKLQIIEEKRLKFICSICDTGIGIPEGRLENLFESFTQVDASTTRKYGGTGLGLAICKKLCKIMQGDIRVTSEEGKGSCFEFELLFKGSENSVKALPQMDLSQQRSFSDRIDAASDTKVKQKQGSVDNTVFASSDIKENHRKTNVEKLIEKPSWSGEPKILLVEDNQVNQYVAQGILSDFGLECDIAVNGLEALEVMQKASKQTPYDLILMDCQMPELDGYQTTRQIRKGQAGRNYKNVAIVAMTANAMLGDRQKCLDAGMDDYVAKPIEENELKETLQKWLLNKEKEGLNLKSTESIPRELKEQKADGENRNEEAGQDATDNNAGSTQTNLTVPEGLRTLDFAVKIPSIARLPAIYLKALGLYIPTTQQQITALKINFDSGDITSLKNAIHAMKGASGNMGMEQVFQYAINLEKKLLEFNAIQKTDFEHFIELLEFSIDDAKSIRRANPKQQSNMAVRAYHLVEEELVQLLTDSLLIPASLIDEFKHSAAKVKSQALVEDVYQALLAFDYQKALRLLQK